MPSISEVVATDTCVGCGACQVATRGEIFVPMNGLGYRQADLSTASASALRAASAVCPFADETPDETEIASSVFPQLHKSDDRVGRWEGVFAARTADLDYRLGSSSGGMTSWLLGQLLSRGWIDGVVHVANGRDSLFEYTISSTASELIARRKSIYYSTSMADAIDRIRGNGRRYAIVGVPCFITAARHLARTDESLGAQLRYYVGLVCGHLKSAAFAQSLAWQAGVAPTELASMDFRVKKPRSDAGDYDFAATDRVGRRAELRTRSTVGGNWGHALFQLNACNYCDDVFAETADVVFGDAWLPEYRSDWTGMNIVVTRRPEITKLVQAAIASGELEGETLPVARAAASQAANFRHRREGLAIRLHDDATAGRWFPRKRVAPVAGSSPARSAIVRSRRALGQVSHDLFRQAVESGNLETYIEAIRPIVLQHDRLARPNLLRRVATRLAHSRASALRSRS